MITSEHCGDIRSQIEDEPFVWALPTDMIQIMETELNPIWIIDMTPMHVINIKDDMTIPNPLFNVGLPNPYFTVMCEQPIVVDNKADIKI